MFQDVTLAEGVPLAKERILRLKGLLTSKKGDSSPPEKHQRFRMTFWTVVFFGRIKAFKLCDPIIH